jgi:hypothetical protein
VGNGHGLKISHTGTGTILTPSTSLTLKNVLCVPAIKKNLLSVQKFATDNFVFFEFWPHYFLIKDQATKQILMQGPSEDGVYKHRVLTTNANTTSTSSSLDDWHTRLGHPNVRKLQSLVTQKQLSPSSSSLSPCSRCKLGKLSRIPLASRPHSNTKPFQLVFSDI